MLYPMQEMFCILPPSGKEHRTKVNHLREPKQVPDHQRVGSRGLCCTPPKLFTTHGVTGAHFTKVDNMFSKV